MISHYENELNVLNRDSPKRLFTFTQALCDWVASIPQDFEEKSISETVLNFAEKHKAKSRSCYILYNNFCTYTTRKNHFTIIEEPEEESGLPQIESNDTAILDINVAELAQQMTVYEHELFREINPTELLGCAWSKAEKEKKAQHVLKMTSQFNKISKWVATTICNEMNLSKRVNVYIQFVKLAVVLFFLFNVY